MSQAQFDKHTLDEAWQEVEMTFRTSGMASPLPGFSERWLERMALERARQERKQAITLALSNLVIALGFLGLIGLQVVPPMVSGQNLLAVWVGLLSRMVVSVEMVSGLVKTLLRTLPGLIPASWWVAGLTLMGILLVVWVSMVRQHLQKGVRYE